MRIFCGFGSSERSQWNKKQCPRFRGQKRTGHRKKTTSFSQGTEIPNCEKNMLNKKDGEQYKGSLEIWNNSHCPSTINTWPRGGSAESVLFPWKGWCVSVKNWTLSNLTFWIQAITLWSSILEIHDTALHGNFHWTFPACLVFCQNVTRYPNYHRRPAKDTSAWTFYLFSGSVDHVAGK